MSFTGQRRAVWDCFVICRCAATVAEAAEALGPLGLAPATVYRAVATMADLGLLVRLDALEADAQYSTMPAGHSHPLAAGPAGESSTSTAMVI